MTDPNSWSESLDALVAAPDSHRVLFENDAVRALSVTVTAGETEPLHVHRLPSVMIVTHPAQIRYFDASGTLLWESERREQLESQPPEWLEPEGPHWIVNVDSRDYLAVRIELKR